MTPRIHAAEQGLGPIDIKLNSANICVLPVFALNSPAPMEGHGPHAFRRIRVEPCVRSEVADPPARLCIPLMFDRMVVRRFPIGEDPALNNPN